MVSELPEAVEDYLILCNDGDFADKFVFARELSAKLLTVVQELTKVQARFIDLDPSAKLINESEILRFKETVNSFFTGPQLQENLVTLFELLSLYQLMHERFGEAADWYLKNDYVDGTHLLFTQVLSGLAKI